MPQDLLITCYQKHFQTQAKVTCNPIKKGASGRTIIRISAEGTPSVIAIHYTFERDDNELHKPVSDLLENEGLCLGGSSGVNIAGAVRMAKDMGPGHTIVTILCDYGTRYQSKLFNPEFLREKGLPVPHWLDKEPRNIPSVMEEV